VLFLSFLAAAPEPVHPCTRGAPLHGQELRPTSPSDKERMRKGRGLCKLDTAPVWGQAALVFGARTLMLMLCLRCPVWGQV